MICYIELYTSLHSSAYMMQCGKLHPPQLVVVHAQLVGNHRVCILYVYIHRMISIFSK